VRLYALFISNRHKPQERFIASVAYPDCLILAVTESAALLTVQKQKCLKTQNRRHKSTIALTLASAKTMINMSAKRAKKRRVRAKDMKQILQFIEYVLGFFIVISTSIDLSGGNIKVYITGCVFFLAIAIKLSSMRDDTKVSVKTAANVTETSAAGNEASAPDEKK
jgi:hypothetical protein